MAPLLLTILVFLPLVAAVVVAALPEGAARRTALGAALLECLAALAAASAAAPGGFFLREDRAWIPGFGIRYSLGMDGISLLMVLLTAFIVVVAIASSWRDIRDKVPLHYALILASQAGIMGVFLSLDLFFFYLFWELMLIPMFFLIGIWGHGRRIYSAVKFFLFTIIGSLLMLLALIRLYLEHGDRTGVYSFALEQLTATPLPPQTAAWLFAAFLLSFAVKFPLFPVHTWLPDAHTDAPTAGSVILASLLLKTGGYGLIRFGYPLFPEAARAATPLLAAAGIAGILYASWIAFAQDDMKRLVAYSSIGHMGFVALGIAAWTPVSLSASILQMVNHGITTGALFFLVGVLAERTGTRKIAAYGGTWSKAPLLAGLFLLFSMASAGLPGLNNFTGEFMVLASTFRVLPWGAVAAFIGIILPLAYTLRLVQAVLYGQESAAALTPLTLRETATLGALAALVFFIGLHPAPLLEVMHAPVAALTGVVP